VHEEQLREAFALVDEMRLDDAAQSKNSLIENPASIRVELADGQKYTVDTPDDVLKLENKRRERITRVVIRSHTFSHRSATIRLGSYHWGTAEAAEIEVSGPVDKNRLTLSRFNNILDLEKDILLQILSMPIWLLALALTGTIHFTIGLFSQNNIAEIGRAFSSGNVGLLLAYATIFWVIPVFFLTTALHWMVGGWFGRAIFLWGGGKARYENKRKIMLFVVYTIPVAVLGKFVANYYGVH
jgi:hypothetical protein